MDSSETVDSAQGLPKARRVAPYVFTPREFHSVRTRVLARVPWSGGGTAPTDSVGVGVGVIDGAAGDGSGPVPDSSHDSWKVPSAVPEPSTRMYSVELTGGLLYVTMGAVDTDWLLSQPLSVAVCTTLELDRRGVRHVDSSHSTDANVVDGEHVDSFSVVAPAGTKMEKYASPDDCPKYDGLLVLDDVIDPALPLRGVMDSAVPQLLSTNPQLQSHQPSLCSNNISNNNVNNNNNINDINIGNNAREVAFKTIADTVIGQDHRLPRYRRLTHLHTPLTQDAHVCGAHVVPLATKVEPPGGRYVRKLGVVASLSLTIASVAEHISVL